MGVIEIIQGMLDELVNKEVVSNVVAATRDGLLIASSPYKGFKEEVFAAMCATILASAETALSELVGGTPEIIFARGEKSTLVVMGAGNTALVGVVLSSEGGVDEVEKVAENVGRVIDGYRE